MSLKEFTKKNSKPKLDFKWAKKRWADPLTGTEIVCISPDQKLHFRNPYFTLNMFTRDGQKMVLMSQEEIDGSPGTLWCIDLISGEVHKLGTYKYKGLTWWAISPQSHLLHVLDTVDDFVQIVRINLDTGEFIRIKPTIPLTMIYDAGCSADDKYIYTPFWEKQRPANISNTEWTSMMGVEPGQNIMYRINLETGETVGVFETDKWWMGHPNPNPINPELFMCCQEGFIWTEQYPRPKNFQRQRIYDFKKKTWLNMMTKMHSRGSHEIWNTNGTRIYSHEVYGSYGCHTIFTTDLETETSTRYICPPDYGMSIHIYPAPDEFFIIGDGLNFCKKDQTQLKKAGNPGDGDNPWSWDGMFNTSPGETIWKYELPLETLWTEEKEYASNKKCHDDISHNPDKVVKTSPVCKFRSMSKLKLNGIRLESNAHVTPDSCWVVFQSASEEGFFEIWAARI